MSTPLRQDIEKLAADIPALQPLLQPVINAAGEMPRYVPKRIASAIDRLAARHLASAVIVGDIFFSQWGYDQTNLDYYQVVKTTPKMIALRKIDKRMTRGRGEPTEYYMPIANKFTGPELRKKLKEHRGRAYVDLNSYASAYKWDGKERDQTGGAFGH